MAGHITTLRLLALFSLLSFVQQFELRDDEWEELRPDVAALHRLRGLHQHMFHEQLQDPASKRDSFIPGTRVKRSTDRVDIDQIAMSLQDDLQKCESFTDCVIQKGQDLESFLAAIDEHKIQDLLLSASAISHSYSQKLLVMTDQEKSTHDRVQQEYSMDPHYSVVLSKECLFNVSCVPEIDGYTVVKIFGSVSEDGQAVSGLSGSSLAELMLKPLLEGVPVFSLHGNTTADFQHSFIRTLMIRGIRTVLETNEGGHQNYQVMNQLDSVSGYQVPQRPVDHSTQYDHQQILIMQDDPIARKAADYLYAKHPTVSSVYFLDKNKRVKLIHGESVPLSEDSRLVLVGHGTRDNSGEMRLAGFSAKEVTGIIQQTPRIADKIKTTSVVACEVGLDKVFTETLLKELHNTAGITTELHLRDAVLQVRHTGEKITQDISAERLQWRHKDDSKKVVANLDKNGNVIVRNEPGSRGEAIFTNERNFLMPQHLNSRFSTFKYSWPDAPQRFVDPNIFKYKDQNKLKQVHDACDELDALSWGLFHADLPDPERMKINNLQHIIQDYVIADIDYESKVLKEWVNDEQKIKDILSECYDIKSGEDVRKVIRHYAKTGEDERTYLKVNDWIYVIDPQTLYVYPVGKKLDNNQKQQGKIREIKNSISEQIGREKYSDIQQHILNAKFNNPKGRYVQYVKEILGGDYTTRLPLSTEAWCTTYFTASVISESIRNFRTFPLFLMALKTSEHTDNNIREEGLKFFFEDHSMARGFTWIDPSRRGFTGSATPEGSSKLNNFNPSSKGKLMLQLENVVKKEVTQYKLWNRVDANDFLSQMLQTAEKYQITKPTEKETITQDYNTFKKDISSEPRASGSLGGHNDGRTTSQDLKSAKELENTFKLESYFSRGGRLSAEQIHSQIKEKYGENLAGLHVQEGSARMENGQFKCQLVSEGTGAEPVEFKVDLSPESQHYNEKMLKGIDTAVHDLESQHSASSHQVNKYVEHTGTAVGTLGLMLGMRGTVHAFEQGDIKDGVMGALQTAHGVTAMTMSSIARQSLGAETRIARGAAAVIKSPAMRGTMTAIPIIGIGFGIYNFEQDLERGGPLGYIDAAVDGSMIALDVLEIAQPELTPIIVPINIALSAIRMVTDDVYMSIEKELSSLPKDASVLQKVLAVSVGFVKGLLNVATNVAKFFYDSHSEEIEEGHRLIAQISDYRQYYRITKQQDGVGAVDFNSGGSSWNGGGIDFRLGDQDQSKLCMNYFVSTDETPSKSCWDIDTGGSKDIILGLGESHELEHKTLQKKVFLFIPAGSVTVVSGYEAVKDSRYGVYAGNSDANRFFAIQKAEDQHAIEVMLNYYYRLCGEPGDDTFFLGPQRSYVQGSGGQDTYIIPENGGKTIINNYDPSTAVDMLHFSVDYSHISVSKSGDNVVLMYEGSHMVTIEGWFVGEQYRHMNMMSGDGVLFEISPTVVSSVQLVAKGINKMFHTRGDVVNASQPLLSTVTNILGSRYDDVLNGNDEKNLIDGGGGRDHLIGGEGEDIYLVKEPKQSSVLIENYSRDTKTDIAIIEANLHTFKVSVDGDDAVLDAMHENTAIRVTLARWFRSAADRHLFVVTKDLISFSISDNKADCQQSDPFAKCIRSSSLDYSSSTSALVIDLQEDEALNSVTQVRGSNFNDVIKGNKEHNVIIPGRGSDFIQGRGGEDWYIITPGQGVKTINNDSPDRVLDTLFLKEQYQKIAAACEGQSIIIFMQGRKDVILQNWFKSKNYQHLQIKTSDGITAGLTANSSDCSKSLLLPLTVDYRNQKPALLQTHLHDSGLNGCFTYTSKNSEDRFFCSFEGKVMVMNETDSVKQMYGSPGFDIMVGNNKDNVLDPYTGGALMFGGEGKDTYIIKQGSGGMSMIDNFAEDNSIDTVLVDMDFRSGSQVALDSSSGDLYVLIKSNGQHKIGFSLLNYNNGHQHQHLQFLSSDGVSLKLKSLNSTGDIPSFEAEAFKVTLKESQGDCRLDLSSQKNLSNVHTVQGCPSQSNDILGNDQNNALIGGWKDDALDGGEGDDTLIGGNGDDILTGGLGDDILYGEDGNDTMMGDSGRDVFIPGPGADLVDGGPGRDTVLYRGDHDSGKGVYVNLLTGQGRYADAEGDVLKDVETVIGTIYSDILVSGYESSLLKGSDGNDILVSTGGDYLVGGDGNDIYMWAFDHGSVTINNCAKDNATDILYLSLWTRPKFDHQILPDRVVLTLFGQKQRTNQTVVRVTLDGWTSDNNECGHLKLVFKEVEVSVDWLLRKCQKKKPN